MVEGGSSHGVNVSKSGRISIAAMDTYVGRVGTWKGTWFRTWGYLDCSYLRNILVLARMVADVVRSTTSIPHHRTAVLALKVRRGRVGVAAVVTGDILPYLWGLEGPLRTGARHDLRLVARGGGQSTSGCRGVWNIDMSLSHGAPDSIRFAFVQC